MSDLTPPRYWKTWGNAVYWLDRFIEETDRPTSLRELFRLPPLVFDKVRDGWRTKVVLKEEFARDPDALVEFIRRERRPSGWGEDEERRMQ